MISGTGKAFGGGGAPGLRAAGGPAAADQRGLSLHNRPCSSTSRSRPGSTGADPPHPDWGNELIQRSDRWRKALTDAGWPRPGGDGPVLPLVIGGDADALRHGATGTGRMLAVAIRPPTVPEGTARLRLLADLPEGTLDRLLQTLQSR